jgi:hypothetical protein
VARLRHLPQDDVDVASPAAEHGQRFALPLGRALRLRAVVLETQVEDLGAGRRRSHRRVRVEADEHIRLVVVGDRRTLVEADRLVSVARQDHARSHTRLDRAFEPPCHTERDVFLECALGASSALLVAAMARIDDDDPEARSGRGFEQRRFRGRRRRWRLGARRRWCGGFGRLRDQVDDDPSRSAFARNIGGAKRREARAEVERKNDRRVGNAQGLEHVWPRGRWQRCVEHISVEADQQTIAFLRDRVRCRGQHVDRDARQGILRLDACRNPRDPQIAGHDQSRRPPQFHARTECRAQRARDEVDRNEPPLTVFDRRRREGHDPSTRRGERLTGRQRDRRRPGRDGERPYHRVFADGEIEQLRELVQREHLLPGEDTDRQRAAAIAHEDGIGRRSLCTGLGRECGKNRRQQGRDDEQDGARGAEASHQWPGSYQSAWGDHWWHDRHAVCSHSFAQCGQTPAVSKVFQRQWQPGSQYQRSCFCGSQPQRGQRIRRSFGRRNCFSTPGVRR